jgi:sugar transferase EpsL
VQSFHITKKILDVVLSIFGLIIVSPLLLLVALIISVEMGRPVLFIQKRPGLNGKPFVLYKFRTMKNDWNRSGSLLPDKERLTRIGSFIRSTSLDELPGLLNVLIGDMSIVGPRPLLKQYLDRYTPEQARRHEVKPGLTGWAQVNGRNSINWEEKFKLDVWYVDHQSILLDLRIIWMTVLKVLKREGISHKGQATMQEFTGTK